MVAAGIPKTSANHAEVMANFAIELQDMLVDYTWNGHPIQMRIGMHSGRVVAGVIGKCKFTYDVWGDTVNRASRMEHTGVAGKIQISEDTYNLIKHLPSFAFEPRYSLLSFT